MNNINIYQDFTGNSNAYFSTNGYEFQPINDSVVLFKSINYKFIRLEDNIFNLPATSIKRDMIKEEETTADLSENQISEEVQNQIIDKILETSLL